MEAAGRFMAAFDSETGMATSDSDRRLARCTLNPLLEHAEPSEPKWLRSERAQSDANTAQNEPRWESTKATMHRLSSEVATQR